MKHSQNNSSKSAPFQPHFEIVPKSLWRTVLPAFFISTSIFLLPDSTHAQSSGKGSSSGWSQRAQNRESSRWTLQEWLATKERNALMDQWLVMNSPSPYEFYLMGATSDYKTQEDLLPKKSYSSSRGGLGAYAQAIGLSGEYENNLDENYTDVSGLLNVRLLGSTLQTTSLTLSVGQRTRNYVENGQRVSIRNPLSQIALQAYLTKHFGISGLYRYYYQTDHSALGAVEGMLVEGGLFIDFSGLRVFGNWRDDLQTNRPSTGPKKEYRRTGVETGIMIFF